MIDKFYGKMHLCENIYFDLTSGDFQELINIQEGAISEKLDNEKGYATFGCLTNEDGVFLDNVVFPAIISCGDVRADGKKVYSIDDIRNVFLEGGKK